jgi:hypothetical protein
LGLGFEALVVVGSSGVSCDEHVLEKAKAARHGLNLAAKWIGLDWSVDEKNEFCARTGLAAILEPSSSSTRVWLSLWVLSLF